MPGDIESGKLIVKFVQIQISDDELYAVINRFDNITRVGARLLHWLGAPATVRFASVYLSQLVALKGRVRDKRLF